MTSDTASDLATVLRAAQYRAARTTSSRTSHCEPGAKGFRVRKCAERQDADGPRQVSRRPCAITRWNTSQGRTSEADRHCPTCVRVPEYYPQAVLHHERLILKRIAAGETSWNVHLLTAASRERDDFQATGDMAAIARKAMLPTRRLVARPERDAVRLGVILLTCHARSSVRRRLHQRVRRRLEAPCGRSCSSCPSSKPPPWLARK